jgi:HEAT repeat protein
MPPIAQPVLFELLEASIGSVELFPSVWAAAERLADPDAKTRQDALRQLVDLNAPRLSPLVAYLVATRLADPDMEMRHQVVLVLGELLTVDQEGRLADEFVRQYVTTYLSQMRTRLVFSLLQVAERYHDADANIARLFNACPFAGEHLVEILADRTSAISIRKKAIFFVGLVGYLDAIPALERLVARLEARQNGQQAMSFASTQQPDEKELLPELHQALASLRAP